MKAILILIVFLQIFIFSKSKKRNAKYYCTRHLSKIPTEIAQILSTCHHINYNDYDPPYKKVNPNHPINIWARKRRVNYIYAVKLGIELCKEYTRRFDRVHAVQPKLEELKYNLPTFDEDSDELELLQCFPDKFKKSSVVKGYRNYMIKCKIYGIDNHTGNPMDVRYRCVEVPYWLSNSNKVTISELNGSMKVYPN